MNTEKRSNRNSVTPCLEGKISVMGGGSYKERDQGEVCGSHSGCGPRGTGRGKGQVDRGQKGMGGFKILRFFRKYIRVALCCDGKEDFSWKSRGEGENFWGGGNYSYRW